jgi:hypothetical protein
MNNIKPFETQKRGGEPTATAEEKNARNQLAKFDRHFNDPNTVVRLDGQYSSKDGKRKKRYIVMQNGREKYVARFEVKDKKQKLVEVASIRKTTHKDKPAKATATRGKNGK